MSAAPNPWEQGTCNVPMWMGGCPSGHCGEVSNGHQLPERYLWETRGRHPSSVPYCFGHACEAHGGPSKDEPRLFRDGADDSGRSMWCAVMPDFINLQESEAGFDVNPVVAVDKLRAAIAKATKEQP